MAVEEVEGFKRLILPFLADWKSLELRVIAEKGRDGQWVLNSLRVFLEHQARAPLEENLPKVEGLLAVNERRDIDQLFVLLDSLAQGELTLEMERISRTPPRPSPRSTHAGGRGWTRSPSSALIRPPSSSPRETT